MTAENNKRKLTAEAVQELQTVFAGKTKMCSAGHKVKAEICIQPESAEEIKKIITFAGKNGYSVSSSNNPMWTIAGEKSAEPNIFVCLRKFNTIEKVDPVAMSVKVGVHARWKDVLKAVNDAGFTPGARPSDLESTVGSWVVTNNAGVGSYKYGISKDNILNLTAVTEDSLIIETGYDDIGYYMSGFNLTQLFAGSEGTLGIVTGVTLKLAPRGICKAVAYEFPNMESMGAVIKKIVHHASIRPYDISFCSPRKALLVAFQGSEDYVALEEAETDALVGTDAKKIDGCGLWDKRFNYKKKGVDVVIPIINWEKFVAEVKCRCFGSVSDRSTAVFNIGGESRDSLKEKVSKYGGRIVTCAEFPWSPKFMGKVEDKELPRKVTPEIVEKLKGIVGDKNVCIEGTERLLYSKDMAPLPKMSGLAFNNIPDVVVRPSKTCEVSDIVALAYRYGIPIVPRGNSTWGLGGAQPANGGIVIDMSSKFNKIIDLDTENMTVKVGCGCTWKELLDTCMKKGYLIGSMPSSFPAATLGAWLATNGMGIGSYKYGSAKDNMLSLEMVLCDGRVVKCGCEKIASYKKGYNLASLVAGSEGTLAMFCNVTFRMYPLGIIKPLAYEYTGRLSDANAAIQKIIAEPSVRPLHIAWSDARHFENQRKAGIDAPNVKNLLLVTVQGDKKFVELEEKKIDELVAANGGKKLDQHIAEHEWEERCYEFRARKVGVGEIPAEVITPACHWGEFIEECDKAFGTMKMEAGGIIGVMVDRNTALYMPYYFKDDESMLGMAAFAFNFYLGDKATEYGGRTTGFGIFFAWNLDNIHNADTVLYMRRMKTMMDPHDVVNPGHVVCGTTRFGLNLSKGLMGIGSNVIQLAKKLMPADTTFADNRKRFRYNTLEHRREADRIHELGKGSE